MTETLLFFVAVLAASIVVMWCERNRLERQIASLQEELAAERSTVSRQMIELTEAKADKISDAEQFSALQKDYNYVRNFLLEECETSSMLRHSRAVIIDHCRKLKCAIWHNRFAHKIEIDCASDMVDNMRKERDHARKLMDETRQRCGQEVDTLQLHKNMFENRINQLLAEKHRLSISGMDLRQSRKRIIDHCRVLKRSQKDLRHLTDYILDELTTINTAGKP